MEKYTKQEYIDKFGEQMWKEKVENVFGYTNVESIYAVSNGNIALVMKGEK